jgi:ribosomal protein S18 acetylase RimI-like enzyme
MRSGSESPDLGKHLLGPHVVGQRVVVRRVLPDELGPSGGPAMTDVLGVCVSWSETACVIQPESGPAVTIPLSLIVSGKPVPPRPSVRQRVSARSAESHAAPLWPHVLRESLGDWELRSDPAPVGRLLKRANSCLAMGDPGVPFAEAADAVLSFYSALDRDALVQVEAGSSVESAFLDNGWSVLPHGEADFLLASVARASRALRSRLAERASGAPAVELEVVDGVRALAVLADTAHGRAALDGDWLGLYELEVSPSHRRRGHALDVLDRLLEWGAEQGATTAWLHVETDNEPALALYESLGFAPHHTCRYLTGRA